VCSPNGRATVQMCDDNAVVIAGFEASEPIQADQSDVTVHWSGRRIQEWAHKKVCLRIRLRQAELYSYWIA
jgi:hypothetical protein